MARVNYDSFDYKQATAKFNMVRMHYIGKAVQKAEIKQAILTSGLGWHSILLTILINHKCVIKEGRGRACKLFFTKEPLHFTQLYDAHKEYLRVRREMKKEAKPVQKETKKIPYWTTTTTW